MTTSPECNYLISQEDQGYPLHKEDCSKGENDDKQTYLVTFSAAYEVEAIDNDSAEALARKELDNDIKTNSFTPYVEFD